MKLFNQELSMPQIVLANNIGQPTGEIQAQTQKSTMKPITVNADGTLNNPNIKVTEEAKTQLTQALAGEPVTEAPTETPIAVETPAPEPVKQNLAKSQEDERMAAMIRREKAMRARVREYEAKEAAARAEFEAKETAYRTQIEEAQSAKQWQERLKTDLIGTLSEAGYTTDQITQALINQPGPESQLIKSLSDKIAKMEQAQQDNFKRQQQEAESNYKNALKTIEGNVNKLISQNPEFELTQASDSTKKVVSYIEKVWKDEGIMLDVEEAAKDVEEYLTDEAIKLARLKKVQTRIAPPAPKPTPKAAAPAGTTPAPKQATTLTNKMGVHGKPLTAKERAILAFKGQLK
jgi:hypothetical protein